MAKIAKNLMELVGKTPLLQLINFQKNNALKANIFGKLEYFNPAGSIKDRVSVAMIEVAERNGTLKQGDTIIEPTSGNTGIGLAMVASIKGYRLILTMPDNMSTERQQLLKALGAEIVLTEGKKGIAGSVEKANELHQKIAGSFIPQQFANPNNPDIHYRTTAEEIWSDTDGKIDVFVCGVGSAGTITGCGRRLKELNPAIEIIAVEPAASPVLSGGKAAPHIIQGIGAGFVPENYEAKVVDKIIPIDNMDSIRICRTVAKTEGLLLGFSGGAALCAATQLAKQDAYSGKNIVVIFPDSGERYLSTVLFDDEKLPL